MAAPEKEIERAGHTEENKEKDQVADTKNGRVELEAHCCRRRFFKIITWRIFHRLHWTARAGLILVIGLFFRIVFHHHLSLLALIFRVQRTGAL